MKHTAFKKSGILHNLAALIILERLYSMEQVTKENIFPEENSYTIDSKALSAEQYILIHNNCVSEQLTLVNKKPVMVCKLSDNSIIKIQII